MINPYEHYINLDEVPLEREQNFIISSEMKNFEEFLGTCTLADTTFFYKKNYTKKTILQPMAAAELFHAADLHTPPVFASIHDFKDIVYQLTQQIQSIPKFQNATEASETAFATKLRKINDFWTLYEDYELLSIKNWKQIDTWLPLYSPKMKALYLEFMTEKCFDEYINMFLLDTLRTETDRHLRNYFFYKTTSTQKYEGIVPIDLDRVEILCSYNNYPVNNFDFEKNKFETRSPIVTFETLTHKDRLNIICRLLQDGVLSESNINTIKTALGFDMGKTIKDIGKKYDLSEQEINKVYNPIARLWEYNQNTLSREL